MNENTTPRFSESPVSWNTKYITVDGFECQLTLRGESGQEVLDRANGAMAYLLKNGCKPCACGKSYSRQPKTGDGTHSHNGTNGNEGSHTCPIHNVEMRRFEKDGRTWYSHKTDNGWCSGKEK